MPSAESLLPAGESSSSANSGRPKGIIEINDAVYLLSEPEGRKPDIEIVFIHGLQFVDYSDAFWKTWTAGKKDQDGKEVCWPKTWLAEDFPGARILSVSYDSSAIVTRETGRIDLFLAGESLVQNMVDSADVGQHGCPIVFVCHSLGGLVAKQIVLNAHRKFSMERKYVDFLNNIEGFHFYATPHSGSRLADLASYLPIWRNKGPMMKILKVINDDLGRLNEQFDRFASAKEWKFAVVAETHKTSLYGFTAKLVEETSARYTYNKFISVQADHFGVCKPESKVSSSYLYLRNFLADVVQQNVLRNSDVWGLPSFLVGMEDRLAEVISKLKVHSRVGLVGMGGIGKTTLSKHLYNQKRRHFDKCCFLEDVKSNDIKVSQKKLIIDLCGDWNKRKSIDLQLNRAGEYIMTEKVLLVIDDVGSEQNLKALLVDAFQDGHIGSKIIVTTRRHDILIGCMGGEGIIDLDFLKKDQALQLFSHYAFGGLGIEERRQLDSLSRKITESCLGLPLSIEVIGQFLKKFNEPQFAHERMDIWEGALEKLRKAESLDGSRDDKLWATLKISYDDLDEHLQSLFVDFACILGESKFIFFEWEKKNPMELKDRFGRIWGDATGIHHLISRSLIKWNPEKEAFVMHDQLCDLGKSIGNTNRIMCRGYWDSAEWYERYDTSITKVILRTISICIDKCFCYIFEYFFDNCSYDTKELILIIIKCIGTLWVLYYLRWYAGVLIGITIGTLYIFIIICLCFKDSYSRWEESEGLKRMQQNKVSYTLKGLLFLHVSREQFSRIQKRWKKRSREKECVESLRLLNIRGSHVRVVEYFLSFHLSELTWLCLSETGITPRNIQLLRDTFSKLRVLEMVGCWKLKQLPECIGHLLELRELDLTYCVNLMSLPNSMGQLKRLQVLYLRNCFNLVRLPSSLGYLSQLKHLHLNECWNLVELSSTIGDLSQLCTLSLSGCKALKRLPESLGRLSQLKHLRLDKCVSLVELPSTFGDLFQLYPTLNLRECEALERLPESLGRLSQLKHLDLSGCRNLVELPSTLGDLFQLWTLKLCGCISLKRLAESLSHLSQLQHLNLGECVSLVELPSTFGDLFQLWTLKLRGCRSLKRLPESLGRLSQLKHLRLDKCVSLVELPSTFGDLFQLCPTLNLRECEALERLPESLGRLSQLKHLDLSGCRNLVELPLTLGDLFQLWTLKLRGCRSLKRLAESLSHLSQLQHLNLGECVSLVELPSTFGDLFQLWTLKLRGCRSLKRLPESLGRLSQLKHLRLDKCVSLVELPSTFGDLFQLCPTLNLRECEALERLPESLGRLSQLKHLDLSGCRNLVELPLTLGDLFQLWTLKLRGCRSLKRLPESLGRLSQLKHLRLDKCVSLVELPLTFGDLFQLCPTLNLRECEALERLPESLGRLSQLKHLDLSGCRNLVELPSTLGDLFQLWTLKLRGCRSLKRLPESSEKLRWLQLLDIAGCPNVNRADSILHRLEDGGCRVTCCGQFKDCRRCTWLDPCPRQWI